MYYPTHNKQRFAEAKKWIFRVIGVLCSFWALAFEIVLASSRYWRLWEFNDKVVQFVFFGLWEAYYHKEFNISGSVTKMLVRSPINSTWTISPEFEDARTLIVCAVLLELLVLGFSSVAIKIGCSKDSYAETQKFFYLISALLLGLSSLCTLVSVSWNHVVDFYGHTSLDFPVTFPIKKEALIKKHHTPVFPTGILTAALSLFGVAMFFYEMRSLELQSRVKLKCATKLTHPKA